MKGKGKGGMVRKEKEKVIGREDSEDMLIIVKKRANKRNSQTRADCGAA